MGPVTVDDGGTGPGRSKRDCRDRGRDDSLGRPGRTFHPDRSDPRTTSRSSLVPVCYLETHRREYLYGGRPTLLGPATIRVQSGPMVNVYLWRDAGRHGWDPVLDPFHDTRDTRSG